MSIRLLFFFLFFYGNKLATIYTKADINCYCIHIESLFKYGKTNNNSLNRIRIQTDPESFTIYNLSRFHKVFWSLDLGDKSTSHFHNAHTHSRTLLVVNILARAFISFTEFGLLNYRIDWLFVLFLFFLVTLWCTVQHMQAHTCVCPIGYRRLIDWVFIHGLLHFSGLYQFINVVVCGEHSRLLGIVETGAFFIHIMAVLSVLSVSRRTHILEETQYLHIVRRWFP